MNAREKLLADTTKNITHAADVLLYEARSLRRATTDTDGFALRFAVEQRLAGLRKTMDELTDQVAALKILEKV
jgi:tRNA C32,U32 (ribose-2'-O)-methylase TrmJ